MGVGGLCEAAPVRFSRVRRQVGRFYDGGLPAAAGTPGEPAEPGEPPDRTRDPRIVLERHTDEGEESFSLGRRIAYDDRRLGELLVPADTATFRTDLTSVPALLTWLVPKTGKHLPAALLHDGLVRDGEEPPETRSYVSSRGHVLDRVAADRVFRDAMADTGTGPVRRWIVWSAVTLATLVLGRDLAWSRARTWRYRAAVLLTLVTVLVLGYCATADLFDVSWAGSTTLPWMGERSWPVEVAGGLAGAVVVPALLGLAWGRFAVAGMVVGVLLAVLLHVTVGLAVIAGAYLVVEWLARRWPLATASVGVAVVVLAAGVLLALVA